jgi:manganese efflux pump family protein
MSFLSLLWLALGLAMDATAVAAGKGCAAKRLHAGDFAKVALLFGGFQAGMPWLGYLLGARVGALMSAYDHWLAFALLSLLGLKMIRESRSSEDHVRDSTSAPFAMRELTVLALATSIDAFAVGVTLPMLGAPLLLSLLTIGLVTAVTSALGLALGQHFGRMLGPRLDLVGGVVLIGLGTSILVQHLRGAA